MRIRSGRGDGRQYVEQGDGRSAGVLTPIAPYKCNDRLWNRRGWRKSPLGPTSGRGRAPTRARGTPTFPSSKTPGSKWLALLWQILSGTGFPNQFFCDSWVVGFGGADHG